MAWVKEDWLLKLGALLLLIGFAWFATYAFLNNWIGPVGRIVLGVTAGALIMILGWWRMRKYVEQGGIFLALGSAVMILTLFAAREVYDFLTPASALVIMFLSAAFVAFASIRFRVRSLALLSLILGVIAPLLVNAAQPNYIALFTYLFVVVLGTIWIVFLTGYRGLTVAALIAIAAYSFPHLLQLVSANRNILIIFAYAFAVLFFITNTAGIIKNNKNIKTDLLTAAGNGLLLLAWIMAVARKEWQSLILSGWMLVFGIGAFSIFRITRRREPFYVYAGVGIAMLAVATAAELDGAALTIGYTIESLIVALTAFFVLRDPKIAERLGLLLIGPAILTLEHWSRYASSMTVFNKHFSVIFLFTLAVGGLGYFFRLKKQVAGASTKPNLSAAFLVAGLVSAYALFWFVLKAGFRNNDTAVMIALSIYTVIALITYFRGLSSQNRDFRLHGSLLLAFVIGRLFVVDIWQMALAGRITTFFLVGALLASTAFVSRRKKLTKSQPQPRA